MHPFNSNHKRPRDNSPHLSSAYSSPEPNFPSPHSYHAPPTSMPGTGGGASASSFRNVSACNRCRLRKNRCDQKLPACSSCEKAKVKCVGIDPITKREIPRAYVYYLENRVTHLEDLLYSNGIPFPPAEDFDVGAPKNGTRTNTSPPQSDNGKPVNLVKTKKQEEQENINRLVDNVSMVSVHGASDNRYLGSTSGISFARVVFAAVRSSISGSAGSTGMKDASGGKLFGPPAVAGTTMRDSFFGLQSKPKFKKAPFPDKELGSHLVYLYFEYANPQTPVLHRGEFMALLDRTYALEEEKRSPRELYMLNIVYAIGAGVIYGENRETGPPRPETKSPSPSTKRLKVASQQHQPEEYHAAAMEHLEFFLSAMPTSKRPEGFGGSLEELQAVLLLASFALLRPVAPGLWYIIGVAVRLAVDLGLHYEDGTGIEDSVVGTELARGQEVVIQAAGASPIPVEPKEKGRRQWVRDLRRRLWWCVYSFDRLVSTCVGRPLGITDQVITTAFPSILDDAFITTSGFTAPPGTENGPSYKRVSYHFFRYRLLQSEILQVLQHRQAKQTRLRGQKKLDGYMHTNLSSPFLDKFENYFHWRKDIDERLGAWVDSAPTESQVASKYDPLFFELNYWQAIIMLYRQSLTAPVELNEPTPLDDISQPEERMDAEDDEEIFMKVATAGQRVLSIYYKLHKQRVVSYTFLSTHHLFMAGIAFLYAIWHSVNVRNCLTVEDVDYTVLAATTVLSSLTEKCPPAATCREAFERMARATVNMVLRTTGFGNRLPRLDIPKAKRPRSASPNERSESNTSLSQFESKPGQQAYISTSAGERVPVYRAPARHFQLDPNIRELFPEDTPETQRFRTVRWGAAAAGKTANKNGVQVNTREAAQHRTTPMHSPASPAISIETNGPPTGDATNHQSMSQAMQSGNPRSSIPHNATSTSSSTAVPGTPSSYSTFNLDNNTPTTPMGPSASLHAPQGVHLLQPHSTSSYHNAEISLAALAEPGYHTHPQHLSQTLQPYSSELDFLMNPSQAELGSMNTAYMATSGLSLGFDTNHDWNDGIGPDLLDGYWFRPGYAGNGSISGSSGLNAIIPGVSGQDMSMGMMQAWGMGGHGGVQQPDAWVHQQQQQQHSSMMPPPTPTHQHNPHHHQHHQQQHHPQQQHPQQHQQHQNQNHQQFSQQHHQQHQHMREWERK